VLTVVREARLTGCFGAMADFEARDVKEHRNVIDQPRLGSGALGLLRKNYRSIGDQRDTVFGEAKGRWGQASPDLVAELRIALEGRTELIVDLGLIISSEQNHEL
jgi:hypothetical protein